MRYIVLVKQSHKRDFLDQKNFKVLSAISPQQFSNAKCPLFTGIILASGRSFANASAPDQIKEGSSLGLLKISVDKVQVNIVR